MGRCCMLIRLVISGGVVRERDGRGKRERGRKRNNVMFFAMWNALKNALLIVCTCEFLES